MKFSEYEVGIHVREILRGMDASIYRGTRYVTEKFTVKVTRRFKPRSGSRIMEYLVTAGRPNYLEQEFIKKCKAVGRPFPMKKIQFKHYPEKQRLAA